jgi:hypothetical protein
VVVGSVVGSVAGASIIIFALLFILKWWRRNQGRIALGDGDGAESTRGGQSGGMVQRRSFAQAIPAALAGLAGYKSSMHKTDADGTISTTIGADRGFYRVSGRKLTSVLQTGGDGYEDDNWEGAISESSFYRDSQGFHGGPGGPLVPSPPAGISRPRDSDIPVMRPSPARKPVTSEGYFSPLVPPPLNVPPRRPDVLGRSRPSQDSSHHSRFTEQV